MNNELSQDRPIDVETAAGIQVAYSVAGFLGTETQMFKAEVEMQPAFTFELGLPEGGSASVEIPQNENTYIGRARTELPCWQGPGNSFAVAYTDTIDLPGLPKVLLHVVGNVTPSSTMNPSPGPYATVKFEGFLPTEYPVAVRLVHVEAGSTHETEVTANEDGELHAFSNYPTSPLVAIIVQPNGFIDTAIEVNANGAGTTPFPDGPATRRIRVILDQAIIDPPL